MSDELERRKGQIIEDFHRVYYDSFESTWETTTWQGVKILKNPCDIIMYQELIWETQPDVIVETGTAYGGSALFFAHMLDFTGKGAVFTIDVEGENLFPDRPQHPRIVYIRGSSTDPMIWKMVDANCRGKRAMVVLDADHRKGHVLKELALWSETVSPGCYLVVEDVNVNGRPVVPEHGPGPAEALEDWLKTDQAKTFKVDASRERYLLTFNKWLRKRA